MSHVSRWSVLLLLSNRLLRSVFVGHALLAFALAAGGAALLGADRRRATALGIVAAAFATAPDVDMAYAVVGVWGVAVDAVAPTGAGWVLVNAFWSTGNVVHRTVTHSLVVAPVVALAAALWLRGRRRTAAVDAATGDSVPGARPFVGGAVLGLAGLVAVATVESGPLGGAVMALFGLVCLALAEVTARRTDLGAVPAFGAALLGVVSHPFGDLLTGDPPAMLYPLDATLFAERLTPFGDSTLNLLTAFGVELAAVWLGVGVFLWLTGVAPHVALNRRATLGAGYAASAFVLPAPTLDVSYPFVFSVIAVGVVGLMPRVRLVPPADGPRVALPDGTSAAVTGLAAITVAGIAYTLAYLLV